MIKSFKDKESKQIFYRKIARRIPSSIYRLTLRKLLILDAAVILTDLIIPPGNKLKSLKGKRKGQNSIRINKQYRICFIWKNGNVYNVEIVDYH